MEILRSPGVYVEVVGIGFAGLAQNDPDQIMRTALVIFCLHLGCNFVVRLGEHIFQLYLPGIVAKSFEWNDFSHAQKSVYCILSSDAGNPCFGEKQGLPASLDRMQ